MTALVLALAVYSSLVSLAALLFARRCGYWMFQAQAWEMWYRANHEQPQRPGMNQSFRARIDIVGKWKWRKEVDKILKDIEAQYGQEG